MDTSEGTAIHPERRARFVTTLAVHFTAASTTLIPGPRWCCCFVGLPRVWPTARLARELGLWREQLHALRQRIQANLNATAPTEVMTGTAFEADELYQNAGEIKLAASRPRRSATSPRE